MIENVIKEDLYQIFYYKYYYFLKYIRFSLEDEEGDDVIENIKIMELEIGVLVSDIDIVELDIDLFEDGEQDY